MLSFFRYEMKDPWQIKAARWCVSKKLFSLAELEAFLKTLGVEQWQARQFYQETVQQPAGTQFNRSHDNDGRYFAPIEMVSMVTDFDELREARINARQAFWFSIAALIVSSVGALLQTLEYFKISLR